MDIDLSDFIDETPAQDDWLVIARSCLISQSKTIPEPDTVCFLTNNTAPYSLLTRGSISTFTGKAKTGKTTALALLIAPVILDKRVLWIDTEQGLYYASKTQHYILKVAGLAICDNLQMFDLRQYNPPDRLQIIHALIKDQSYDLIVLDGVRDVIYDINSPEEATNTITQLMAWSVQYDCHISMVLHQNKGNTDVRGHLGTEAINKSEIVISVTKTVDNPPAALVACEFCRGLSFNDFYIKRDEAGIPFIDNDYQSRDSNRQKLPNPIEIEENIHFEILRMVFQNSEQLSSANFISGLCAAWTTSGSDSMKQSWAQVFKAFYIQKGFIKAREHQKGNLTFIELDEEVKQSINKKSHLNNPFE